MLALKHIGLAVAFALTVTAAPASAQPATTIRLIAINDFHGHLEPGDNMIEAPHPSDASRVLPIRSGGAAFLAARIRQLRAEQPHHLLISSGDLIGASPLASALFRDEPTVEVMNALALDLNAVGNHEFDQGVVELRRMVHGGCAQTPRGDAATCANPAGRYEGARFPFLAANVVDADDRPLFAPTLVRQVDGVRIGFIGAVTRSTPGIVMPAGIRGWRFRGEAETLNRYAAELRAQGVRTIVAVVHEGGETDGGFNACDNPRGEIFDIERRLDPAIDVVLSAHTHRGYNCTVGERIVIQGASFGRLVSVVDLAIDRASGAVVRARSSARNVLVPNDRNTDPAVRAAYPALDPDAAIERIVAHYRERAEPIAARPAGRISASFTRRVGAGGDHAAGRLIADAHLAATADNGAQIAFTNPGGVRTDLVARAPDGRVTYGDVFAMQPFGNSLVTMTMSGAQIRRLLEGQWNARDPERVRFLLPSRGFTYVWREDRAQGARIDPESLRLNGDRIAPERSYRVTVNSYLAAGGDGFRIFRDGSERIGGPLDVDALVDYLRAQSKDGPLAPDARARIARVGNQ